MVNKKTQQNYEKKFEQQKKQIENNKKTQQLENTKKLSFLQKIAYKKNLKKLNKLSKLPTKTLTNQQEQELRIIIIQAITELQDLFILEDNNGKEYTKTTLQQETTQELQNILETTTNELEKIA